MNSQRCDFHNADDHAGAAPLLLDVKRVACLLTLSVRTVWRLTSEGELPAPISIGRSKRWERRAIEEYVAKKASAMSRRVV